MPPGSSGNANEKSGPKGLPDSVHETTKAIVADRCIPTSGIGVGNAARKYRADQVLVTADAGDIGFYFDSSASFAPLATAEGSDPAGLSATGSLSGSQHYVNFGTNLTARGPIDIHPLAWSGSAASSVVFIYKKGGF